MGGESADGSVGAGRHDGGDRFDPSIDGVSYEPPEYCLWLSIPMSGRLGTTEEME